MKYQRSLQNRKYRKCLKNLLSPQNLHDLNFRRNHKNQKFPKNRLNLKNRAIRQAQPTLKNESIRQIDILLFRTGQQSTKIVLLSV